MTSIAAYLASLTGVAPQEGQAATPANISGAGGLFAALLQSTNGQQAPQGLFDQIIGADGQPILPEQTGPVLTEGTTLGQALSQGLVTPEGEEPVEALILDTPQASKAETAGSLTPTQPVAVEGETNATPVIPVNHPEAEGTVQVTVTEALPIDPETPDPIADQQPTAVETAAVPVPLQTEQTPQSERPTGLQNALSRASENGRENGLANALNRAPRAGGQGREPAPEPQPQPNANAQPQEQSRPAAQPNPNPQAQIQPQIRPQVQNDVKPDQRPQAQVQGEKPATANRPVALPATDAPAPTAGGNRPVFVSSPPEPVQKLIQTGQGQILIQTQASNGGETAILQSPPTLTANVQASAASPGPVSPNTPHVPVGSLAVHIAQQANNGARRFDIRLDPPELGRIEVRLDVSREGQVMTHLVVERAETLDLLQRDARQLERALQDAGLNTSEDGMKFSLKDQGLANGGDESSESDSGGKAGAGEDQNENSADTAEGSMPPARLYSASGGLDIRI